MDLIEKDSKRKKGFRIICDFDGVVTKEDTIHLLFLKFGRSGWEDIVHLYRKGKLTILECMAKQVSFLDLKKEDLRDFARVYIEIDPTFKEFLKFLEERDIPIAVVSDGIDRIIFETFLKYSIKIPYFSNRLKFYGEKLHLSFPYYRESCALKRGVCKCLFLNPSCYNIVIGDGISDLCVAKKADFVFAKGRLCGLLDREGITYFRFSNFFEIKEMLKDILIEEV